MRFVLALVLAWVTLCSGEARALSGEWAQTENAQLRLIASDKVDGSGQLYAGLQLRLNPHWHAYWRSPGDAGLPPAPDWKNSTNLSHAELLFPWPKRSSLQGFETYGYEGEVIFPVRLAVADKAVPLPLKTTVSFLICSDICIPAEFSVSLDIPAQFGAAEADEASGLLKAAYAHVPRTDEGAGLGLKSAHLVEEQGKRIMAVVYTAPHPITDAELIMEMGDGSTLAIADKKILPDQNTLRIELAESAPKELAGKEFTFTLIDEAGAQAVEKKMLLQSTGMTVAPPGPAPMPAHPAFGTSPAAPPAPTASVPSLALMVVFALLGGLILNLMPCVLPVIALKSLAFVSHGGGTPTGVRLSFLATSAGIIFSFLVMALSLIGLKEAGMSIGWGVQFQHPLFLIFLVAVLLFFSANLIGFFEIPLPRFLADRLSWNEGHGNLFKDFLSGAFATLLATPCTAPFLGTAIGFALAGGAREIFIIFMALGTGLAAPFLLIALFPQMATWLPKPGAWMVGVKKIMGGLLLLTALWLGIVLAGQLGVARAEEKTWHAFEESRIHALVLEGKIVFVDVTADWCLTCKANKKFVLEREEVAALLQNERIALMKADWTKPDEGIAAFLRKYNRFGIPFNIIYGPKAPDGVMLPELLSRAAVEEGLEKAGF